MPKLLSEFDSEIRFITPDCPSPVIERAVRLSAIEFCERSWFWRYTTDPIGVFAGDTEVPLSLPEDSIAVVPLKATYDMRDIEITTDRSLLTPSPGLVDSIYVEDDVAHLSPIPESDSSEGLILRLALKPISTATSIDDRLVNHFNEEIVAGAARYLLAMPAQFNWSNPQLALYYNQVFDEGVFRAKRKGSGADAPVVRTVSYGGY